MRLVPRYDRYPFIPAKDEGDAGTKRLAIQYPDDNPDVPPSGMVCSARLGKGETLL